MSDGPEFNPLERRIVDYLAEHAMGPRNAVTRDTLLDYLDHIGSELGDRKMRATVEHLVRAHGVPICTSARRGYWLGVNGSDRQEAVAMLRAAASEMMERAAALERAGGAWQKGQLKLEI